MAIVQISKIQHRTGNLIDLPQLSDAELGWASDANRLFIGTTPPQNIEVLTSYSSISFSQIDGSSNANLNLSNVMNGQVLAYDTTTTSWTNKGGNASDPGNASYYTNTNIHLGNVSNVKIGGGVNGYVLQTDGSGNLNWTEQIAGTPGNGLPGGANTQIQYNDGGFFGGTSGFTFDKVSGAVAMPGTVSVSNTVTATRLISNIATGTAPLTVTSTTQVANLNVATAGLATFATTANSVAGSNVSGQVGNALIAGTVYTAAQPNITSVGTLTSLAVTGNITSGNASLGNAVTANYFIGSGANLTSIPGGNVSGQVANALVAGTVYTAAQPNITSVGTLTTLGVNGTVTAVAFTANTGIFTGNGSGLTNIAGANVTGTVPLATSATTAGTVTTAAQGNITSVGTLTGLTIAGNIIPSVDQTYNLGNATNAFKDLYLSGNTIYLGNSGATITANASAVIITSPSGNAVPMKPGGANTQVQYNDDGIFGGNPGMVFNEGTTTLTVNNFAVLNAANLANSTLTVKAITTGANTTAGTITGNWSLTTGSQLRATYADLAEYYEADKPYEPGTVVEFGGPKEVTIAEDGTTRVAGVVSTNPAYVMNSQCKGDYIVALALQGRVPCKVRGTVHKGDMLVSAGEGYARPMIHPYIGSVIGKSLENFDGIEGIIEVAVGRL